MKYQVMSGYELKDDGSVSCRDYWALNRSTGRIGNELVYTAIGDFAEGVPFEEWPHWLQYASEPPNQDALTAARQEMPIPEAVNKLFTSLKRLNASFSEMAKSRGVILDTPLWEGSLDSLAGRQLKWVYPTTSDDDEFLKRATLTSTLFLDGLQIAPVRSFLGTIHPKLHETFDRPPKPLGSRKLLERAALRYVIDYGASAKEFEADEVDAGSRRQRCCRVRTRSQGRTEKPVHTSSQGICAPRFPI